VTELDFYFLLNLDVSWDLAVRCLSWTVADHEDYWLMIAEQEQADY
jgi:hypothetical protein